MAALDAREVRLNVYDLAEANGWLSRIGVGAYHTGIEVAGFEYSFCDEGVFKTKPRGAPPPAVFKESLVLGTHNGSANDVSRVIRELREEFPAGTYDILKKNCNVFSNALSLRLVGVEIPRYINRLAGIGAFFSGGKKVERADESGSDKNKQGNSGVDRSKRKELTDQQKAALAKLKNSAQTK